MRRSNLKSYIVTSVITTTKANDKLSLKEALVLHILYELRHKHELMYI